jgi:hypothetical protein
MKDSCPVGKYLSKGMRTCGGHTRLLIRGRVLVGRTIGEGRVYGVENHDHKVEEFRVSVSISVNT